MKYDKYYVVVLSILILFVFIGSVSAADVNGTDILPTIDDNEILSTTIDDNEILSTGNDVGNYSELSREIAGGGRIELQHDYYTYDSGDTITISDNCFIEGKGAVIDMAGSSIRAFIINGSNVMINNLTIKNVNSEDEGGAIYSETGGIVTNCNFINNSAGFTGGAISFKNVTGSVANCNFIENSAAQGSAVCFWDVAGNVTNCTFTDNSAASAGALYLCGGIVSGCTFTGNSNFGRGGAIASFTNVANIVNCTFTDNYGAQGGAIAFYYADCNVTGCTFIGNAAIIGTDGGAIWTGGGNVTNCTFVNNTAESAGGAISFYDYCIVTDCTFLNNDASGYGGAISLNDGIVTNCNFINNSGEIWGGAIASGHVSVNNCTFTGNTISGDVKNMGGHAIYSNIGGSVTNCVFVDNSAESIKYTIYSAGALYDSLDNNWWGSNDPDWDELISYDQIPSCYAVLDVTAEPDEIRAGGKSDIITKFIWSGTDTDATNLLPKRYIILSSDGNLTQTEGYVGLTSAFYANDEDKYVVNAEVDNEELEVKVKVNGLASPTNITVNVTSLNLTVGESGSINATLNPADAGNLTYTSSNSNIAVVENGMIKAVAAGTAVVTVSFPGSGDYSAAENKTIEVTVTLKDASVSAEDMNLFVGDNATVNYSTNPSNLNVTFVIDDSGVYTVNEKGFVTALKNGTGSILVKVGGDGVYAENSTVVAVTVSKVPTEITVDPASLDLKIGEEDVISANLTPDGAGNLTYTSSNSSIAVVENGKIKGLKAGDAIITLSFAGNEKYAAAENKTIKVTVTLWDASVSVNNSTLDLCVDDNFTIVPTTVPDGLNVTYVPDDSGVVSVDENGVVTALKEGTAHITVKIDGAGVYVENTTSVTVTVSKVPTDIVIANDTLELVLGDAVDSGAALTPFDAGNLSYASSDEAVVKVENGKIIALKAGNAVVTVSFAGDDKYAAAENRTISVVVNRKESKIAAGDVSVKYNDPNAKLVATLTDANGKAIIGNLTVELNGESYTEKTDFGGQISIPIGNLTPKTYVATVTYGGDDIYAPSSATASIVVSKADTIISAQDVNLAYRDPDGVLVANITNEHGKPLIVTLYITLDGKTHNVRTDSSGQARMSLYNVTPGTHTATISYKGSKNYEASNTTALVTVTKAETMISAADVKLAYRDSDSVLVANITNEHGKPLIVTLYITLDGKTHKVITDSSGQARMSLYNVAPGTHTATITYRGSGNYEASSATAQVVVTKAGTVISASDVSMAYRDPSKELVINVVNEHGKTLNVELKVDLNGKTYTVRTNSSGQARISLYNVAPGTHTATITYRGSGNYEASSATAQVVVTKAGTVISASDVSMAYRDPSKELVINVVNEHGKTLNVELKVDLNGKTYTVRTNSSGQARISLYNVAPGTHTATITYRGSGNYEASSATAQVVVTKAGTVISASDVSMAYRDPSKELVINVVNEHGKTLNVELKVDLNGNTYTVRTNSSGEARISLYNVTPGTHTATITYKGSGNYEASNTTAQVKVTKAATMISAPDVTVAYKDPNGKLVSTITNGHGKPLVVNLNVDLNGKTYSVRTDSNGQASVSTADLAPGTYTAAISYKGSSNYKASSTKANIRVN